MDRIKRKVETEVNDLKEQLNERKIQVEELQLQLGKREEELTQAQMRVDEEAAGKALIQKTLRELESQYTKSQEDLEAERVARAKAEKQKRDLNEELKALKNELNELLDSLDTTAAMQELRSKREQELATLKKTLEEDAQTHEVLLTEMRYKHSQELAEINEELDALKKSNAALEKAKRALEAENADLAGDSHLLELARPIRQDPKPILVYVDDDLDEPDNLSINKDSEWPKFEEEVIGALLRYENDDDTDLFVQKLVTIIKSNENYIRIIKKMTPDDMCRIDKLLLIHLCLLNHAKHDIIEEINKKEEEDRKKKITDRKKKITDRKKKITDRKKKEYDISQLIDELWG